MAARRGTAAALGAASGAPLLLARLPGEFSRDLGAKEGANGAVKPCPLPGKAWPRLGLGGAGARKGGAGPPGSVPRLHRGGCRAEGWDTESGRGTVTALHRNHRPVTMATQPSCRDQAPSL